MELSSVNGRVDRVAGDAEAVVFITVVVPVRNEAQHIAWTLEQLLTQDYPADRFEILVVDGESTDETTTVVRQVMNTDDRVRLHANPGRRSSAARNVGIRHARGDVVLIVDGHCEIPSKRMLANLAKAFDQSGAECIGRPQPLDTSNANLLQRAIAAARSSGLGHHPESYIYSSRPQFVPAKSVAVAYRREVFQHIGYFDEHFDAHEDGDFNYRCDRAGLRCYFTPDIAVKYHPRRTLLGLFGQMIRYGRGRIRVLRKHPGTRSLGTLAPALFVVGLIMGIPLSLVSSWCAIAYLTCLSLYVAVLLWFSARIAVEQSDPRLLVWLPLVFATVHIGAGVGLIAELRRGLPLLGRRITRY